MRESPLPFYSAEGMFHDRLSSPVFLFSSGYLSIIMIHIVFVDVSIEHPTSFRFLWSMGYTYIFPRAFLAVSPVGYVSHKRDTIVTLIYLSLTIESYIFWTSVWVVIFIVIEFCFTDPGVFRFRSFTFWRHEGIDIIIMTSSYLLSRIVSLIWFSKIHAVIRTEIPYSAGVVS